MEKSTLQTALDEIVNQYIVDSKIDETTITSQSVQTASLHCKYINHLRQWKDKRLAYQIKFDKLKQDKIRYWRGEFSQHELQQHGWSQWQNNRPLKSEIDGMINADDDLNKIRYQLELIQNGIDTIEAIIKSINNRDFMISNFIKLKKYYAGEDF